VGNKAPHAFDGSERDMEASVLDWMKQTAPCAA